MYRCLKKKKKKTKQNKTMQDTCIVCLRKIEKRT